MLQKKPELLFCEFRQEQLKLPKRLAAPEPGLIRAAVLVDVSLIKGG